MLTGSKIAAIDPGKLGGIAVGTVEGGVTHVHKMPPTVRTIAALICELDPELVILELVGGHRAGNSAISTATFARHNGALEGILAMAGIETLPVGPSKWIPAILGGEKIENKTERKNALKAIAKEYAPDQKVTLAVSDAICLFKWYADQKEQ